MLQLNSTKFYKATLIFGIYIKTNLRQWIWQSIQWWSILDAFQTTRKGRWKGIDRQSSCLISRPMEWHTQGKIGRGTHCFKINFWYFLKASFFLQQTQFSISAVTMPPGDIKKRSMSEVLGKILNTCPLWIWLGKVSISKALPVLRKDLQTNF